MNRTIRILSCVLVFLTLNVLAYAAGGAERSAAGRVINISSVMADGTPADLGAKKFKEDFERATGGRYQVFVHPNSAMGTEQQNFEMLADGSVEVAINGALDISLVYPEHFAMEIPFIFRDADMFWRYWNGPGKEVGDLMEREHGVRTAGVVLRGARYLTSNRPIRNMTELRGLRLRIPPIQAHHDFWSAFGAVPSSIAFSEVYLALATGAVDAQENPPESIIAMRFNEVQRYIMPTRHIFSSNRFLVSMRWFNTLPAEDQRIFNDCMRAAVDYANGLASELDAQLLEELIAGGMELINIDLTDFLRASQTLIEEKARSEWAPGLWDRIRNL